MKRLLAASALGVFGLAPAIGAACDYNDESSASVSPPAQFAAPTPAATKVPAPTVAKTLAPNSVKPVVAKAKPAAPEQKVAAGVTN